MKKRIYKLKESKAVKTLLALSLAFVLLFGICPVQASASTYPDLPSNKDECWVLLKLNCTDATCVEGNTYWYFDTGSAESGSSIVRYDFSMTCSDEGSKFSNWKLTCANGKKYSFDENYVYVNGAWQRYGAGANQIGGVSGELFSGSVSVELIDSHGIDVYLTVNSGEAVKMEKAPTSLGNATETEWNEFLANTKDFVGYHYVTENGATLWKEMRFDHVVYPYWEQGEGGVRKLMVYVPYEQTNYMTKDVGRYVEDGIYDYYISTVERTDEHCIQPYAWYTDYQPDTSTPEKVFEVIVLPYIKEGYGVDANAERTLRTVYSSKSEAMSAYLLDNPPPTEEPTPTIIPEPTMPPLEPSDDNMGMFNFIKEWETLFNASGNFWKIMQYTFLYVPYELIAPVASLLSITLALIVIRMVT